MPLKYAEARKFLGQVQELHSRIDRSLHRFELMAEHTDKMRRMVAGIGIEYDSKSSLEKYSNELMQRNDLLCDQLREATREIEETILAATSGSVAEMLEERYLCCRLMEEIEKHCHWSRRWVIRLHMQGLEAVQNYLATRKQDTSAT
ncbi:MAG: hypothetical protein PHI98_03890 [Eubacteriales bacterium]|nr:hypothetical protein [Eubacteriales bacterium]